MKKKLLKLSSIALLSLCLSLAPLNTFAEEKTIEEAEAGETITTEGGDFKVIKINKDFEEQIEHGPFTIKINYISAVNVKPSEELKPFLNDQDEVNLLSIDLEIENTSDDNYSIYPNSSQLVVNKKQLDPDFLLSDDIGGDFLGNVIKEGTLQFVYDDDLEEVEEMKLVIGSGQDDDFNLIGEDIVIEFNFDEDAEDEDSTSDAE